MINGFKNNKKDLKNNKIPKKKLEKKKIKKKC
jgi:hypothetical protein